MLLNEFSVIFDRPEKVKKLREYILSLAVRGKILQQDENDEPVSVLLEKVREEKNRLVKEKKIKKEKPLPEISECELPYELPKGWEWVRLMDIVALNDNSVRRGPFGSAIKKDMFVPKGENTCKIYEQKNAIKKDWKLGEYYISNEKYEELKRFEVVEGDIIISCAGTIGETYILPKGIEKGIINQALLKIRLNEEVIDNTYFINMFKSLTQREINESAKGSAMKNLVSIDYLKSNVLFPLPSLNEQKRIVEKVDYLMAFCDNLEAQLEEKVKYGSLSAKSVLNGVSNCSFYEELEEALRFIIDNFKDLTLADGAVGELKNAILSLAVKGKLVPQDESDEPASALLERIREEKDRLVKDKKIKKEKPLPEISEDEIPYELPKDWEWIRMRELAQNIHYGYTASAKIDNTGVKFVRITDIQNNMVNWGTVPYCDIDEKKLESCKLENNDILIARTGGTIGKSFIVENVEYSAVFASYLIRVIPLKSINPRYLKLFLETPLYWRQLISKSQGTGQPNVNAVSLSELVMPLPSINEQERIIDRVEKLMKVCDELELRIEKSKKYSEKLMECILKNSFKA
ncbi:restriction endonuclease subunit S [Romboutsia sp. 1001713B170207_170306_H8]|uniref:restriction endonuclease subunit S n=1 Tax=Romboutsia sp. 1001713B170207_170306_H8 TaxID=2787112 RepID=UPI001898C437|nr:restriction endonuclease subunit S [Romboutsia sp. 1001713B170207_170306_H8]